jgi:putative membrane protein
MRRHLIVMSVTFAIVACGGPDDEIDYSDTALGATEQPATQPATEAGAGDVGSWSPANVLAHISTGDSLEVEIARLAESKAASDDVKSVAETIIRDHSANRDEALQLAQQEQIALTPPPADTSAAHASSVMQQLQALQGEEFDRAFVQRQIEHHQDEVRKLTTMQSTVQDPEVRDFVDRTLTAVQEHLDQLQQIPMTTQ